MHGNKGRGVSGRAVERLNRHQKKDQKDLEVPVDTYVQGRSK